MIKIIEPGKCSATKCAYCECVFSYEFEDVIIGTQMDPGDFINCPCCGHSLKVKLIPRRKEVKK